jgi:DNA-binding MarR family transcriptional regulator
MDSIDAILEQWRSERPDLDVESMGLIGRIKRLNAHLMIEMESTFARHGLNHASFDVLATLRRAGDPYQLSAGELIARTMVTSGTMTNRIDQLVSAGYVERIKNPQDGRSVLVSLTESGIKVIDRAVTEHVATQQRLTAELTKRDFDALNQLLSKYLKLLETDELR